MSAYGNAGGAGGAAASEENPHFPEEGGVKIRTYEPGPYEPGAYEENSANIKKENGKTSKQKTRPTRELTKLLEQKQYFENMLADLESEHQDYYYESLINKKRMQLLAENKIQNIYSSFPIAKQALIDEYKAKIVEIQEKIQIIVESNAQKAQNYGRNQRSMYSNWIQQIDIQLPKLYEHKAELEQFKERLFAAPLPKYITTFFRIQHRLKPEEKANITLGWVKKNFEKILEEIDRKIQKMSTEKEDLISLIASEGGSRKRKRKQTRKLRKQKRKLTRKNRQ